MSHFTVLVIGNDYEKQLAPYEEANGIPDERQKWDWYSVGGRWMGYFKLKKGKRGKIGEPGAFKNSPKPGWVDQARKKDIDFEAMIIDARKEADATYTRAGETIAAYQRARTKDAKKGPAGDLYFRYAMDIGKDGEVPTRDEYVAKNTTISTFAVLKDGKWYERAEMGWFGSTRNDKEPKDWEQEFRKLLMSVDDETLLTLVDCHI